MLLNPITIIVMQDCSTAMNTLGNVQEVSRCMLGIFYVYDVVSSSGYLFVIKGSDVFNRLVQI